MGIVSLIMHILDHAGGPDLITWILKIREHFATVTRGSPEYRIKAQRDAISLLLKKEE